MGFLHGCTSDDAPLPWLKIGHEFEEVMKDGFFDDAIAILAPLLTGLISNLLQRP
jgi:hypothetical protein